MSNTQSWNELKKHLKIGTKLTGVVTKHWQFGVFVLLPDIEFIGIVQITDFKDEGVMKPSEYPAVATSIDAVVLGFKDTGEQIWLGMKPSQLNQSINL